jgi:hypothetical protein
MKLTSIAAIAASALVALGISCSKQEGSAPTADQAPPKKTVEVPAPRELPKAAVQQTLPAPPEATPLTISPAQTLIDKARGLIDEKKYAEAFTVLKECSALHLTPEQQKLADDLWALAQQGTAAAATSEGAKLPSGLPGK